MTDGASSEGRSGSRRQQARQDRQAARRQRTARLMSFGESVLSNVVANLLTAGLILLVAAIGGWVRVGFALAAAVDLVMLAVVLLALVWCVWLALEREWTEIHEPLGIVIVALIVLLPMVFEAGGVSRLLHEVLQGWRHA